MGVRSSIKAGVISSLLAAQGVASAASSTEIETAGAAGAEDVWECYKYPDTGARIHATGPTKMEAAWKILLFCDRQSLHCVVRPKDCFLVDDEGLGSRK